MSADRADRYHAQALYADGNRERDRVRAGQFAHSCGEARRTHPLRRDESAARRAAAHLAPAHWMDAGSAQWLTDAPRVVVWKAHGRADAREGKQPGVETG